MYPRMTPATMAIRITAACGIFFFMSLASRRVGSTGTRITRSRSIEVCVGDVRHPSPVRLQEEPAIGDLIDGQLRVERGLGHFFLPSPGIVTIRWYRGGVA